MDCRTALQILDCAGPHTFNDSPTDEAAAEEHLAGCPRCASIVRARRSLDEDLGRVLRDIPVPRGAQQRLLSRIAQLEASTTATEAVGSSPALLVSVQSSTEPIGPLESASPIQPDGRRTQVVAAGLSELEAGEAPGSEPPHRGSPHKGSAQKTRRLTRRFVPAAAACIVIAAISYFGALRLLTPRYTVDEVCTQLAAIDLTTLESLPRFNGVPAAGELPANPGWQKLEWCCEGVAKGLPATSHRHLYAVFGFVIPSRERQTRLSGLLAVIPRNRIRMAPAAESLADAPPSDYSSATMGEARSVAWTSGDVVCVCVTGVDSLSALQRLLQGPAA